MANKFLAVGTVLGRHLSKYFKAIDKEEQFMPRLGNGIKWSESNNQFEVNLGDGLEINSDGQVVVKQLVTEPVTKQILDHGSASVIGEQYTIDYGNGLIEINGLLYFPLDTVPRNKGDEAFPRQKDGFDIGCSNSPMNYADVGEVYHKESRRNFKAQDFGMRKILSVNAIAGDVAGYRTETPWVVNREIFSDNISLGIHTLAKLDQNVVPMMFQVKGLKL